MIDALKTFLTRTLGPAPGIDAEREEDDLRLAAAALLVEVMRADAHFDAAERRALVDALRHEFTIDEGAAAALATRAEQAVAGAIDLVGFTAPLVAALDLPARVRLVEAMWRVAYADGHLEAHERHLMWRVADLLHVPQGDYVMARSRAREAAGGG